jgi:hypothetical protein
VNPLTIALVAIFSFVFGVAAACTVGLRFARLPGFVPGLVRGRFEHLDDEERRELAGELDEVFHEHGFCLVEVHEREGAPALPEDDAAE